MTSLLVALLMGILCVVIPFISWGAWNALLLIFSSYARKVFLGSIGLRSRSAFAKMVWWSLIPYIFLGSAALTAFLAIILEGMGFFMLGILQVLGEEIIAFIMVVLAGPIEESVKLLGAALLFILVSYLSRTGHSGTKGERPSNVKDGMLTGLFVGATFGTVESIGYLLIGLTSLPVQGFDWGTVDALVWRMVFGVSIHAMYTGIASIGLGRRTWGSKVACSLIGLAAASVLHSLNNGIQGVMVFFVEADMMTTLLVVDASQFILILIGAAILVLFYIGAGKGSNSLAKVR